MQDIFESAKRAAGSAVERAAWEADRLRRATTCQHEVELLQRERAALAEQVATVVADLAGRGALSDGPLKALAERLRTLEGEIVAGVAQAQQIRSESYVPGSLAISVRRRADHSDREGSGAPCPTCGQPTRASATFCPRCGTRLR